jgi:hypothetical protein
MYTMGHEVALVFKQALEHHPWKRPRNVVEQAEAVAQMEREGSLPRVTSAHTA